jgi:hypothetical protein
MATYYISTSGSDSNDGSIGSPWATLTKARDTMSPGDTVYLRAGTYTGTGKSYVTLSVGGTAGNYVTYASYPGEQAILDGSDVAFNTVDPWAGPWMIRLTAAYIRLERLEIRNCSTDGVLVSGGGDNCQIVSCVIHDGYYNGVQVNDGAVDGLIEYCTVHSFHDTAQGGENANGLILNGTTNGSITGWTLRNNVVYNVSDDAIDLWRATGSLVYNNIVYDVGLGTDGDGNGFKLGPGGGGTIYNNIAYDCRTIGFDNNEGSNSVYNNTSFRNGTYGFQNYQNAGTYKNNIAYQNTSGNTNFTGPTNTEENNTWNLSITDPLFASTTEGSGSFLRLSATSPCRDAGSDLSGTFTTDILGKTRVAWDLGAYEYQAGGGFSSPRRRRR